jgi:membrane fusion protein, copper/silver efflux system
VKKSYRIILLLLVAAGAFLAGSLVTFYGGNHKSPVERKILYYVDPMNPAFKSEKPGIAPCGMALEPVYADGKPAEGAAELASLPPGTIHVYPEKQQLIGIKVAAVEKIPWNHTLRVLGRVTPDETRVYRINAAVSGWVDDALPVTTGSLVEKNQLLATFYSLEYRSLLQSYFNIIDSGKPNSSITKPEESTARYSAAQLKQMRGTIRALGQSTENSQADYYKKNLFNYGMSEYQLEEMERTRKIPEVLDIRAPIAGFILSRNVSPGLRFDRGVEFFRIADLSRVWILADIFENEAALFQPGLRVKMELPYQKKTLYGKMSTVLPQFDPATRTIKIRLEADNPGFNMRPDMFVNVEMPVSGAAAIIIPGDAVIDSGLKKTVFVDRGNGYFEPRQVETGRWLGERVEITRGLMAGEKIVVAGNFLIDSESRMQQAATGIFGKIGRDPVCGMNVDEDRARLEGNVREYKGKSYYFCSLESRDDFDKDPERYISAAPARSIMPPSGERANTRGNQATYSAMKSENPRNMQATPHDHRDMKMDKPENPERQTAPSNKSPLPGDAQSSLPAPAPYNPTMMAPGPGMLSPGSPGTNPLPAPIPGGMPPAPAAAPVPMLPAPGAGSFSPGMPGSVTIPQPMPGGTPAATFDAPVQKAPGPANDAIVPGSSSVPPLWEPTPEMSGRTTSRPPRRRGLGTLDGAVTPGAPVIPSVPEPKSKQMISPAKDSTVTQQQTKDASGGQNHD